MNCIQALSLCARMRQFVHLLGVQQPRMLGATEPIPLVRLSMHAASAPQARGSGLCLYLQHLSISATWRFPKQINSMCCMGCPLITSPRWAGE